MGMNEGVNVFVDNEGGFAQNGMYIPAYIRRYPFMLAKLHPDAQELSLCFDPTTDLIGAFEEGLHAHFANTAGELIAKVNDSGDWNGEIEAAFKKGIGEFKTTGSW
jgi:hypothetical protein